MTSSKSRRATRARVDAACAQLRADAERLLRAATPCAGSGTGADADADADADVKAGIDAIAAELSDLVATHVFLDPPSLETDAARMATECRRAPRFDREVAMCWLWVHETLVPKMSAAARADISTFARAALSLGPKPAAAITLADDDNAATASAAAASVPRDGAAALRDAVCASVCARLAQRADEWARHTGVRLLERMRLLVQEQAAAAAARAAAKKRRHSKLL